MMKGQTWDILKLAAGIILFVLLLFIVIAIYTYFKTNLFTTA
jgi:hypothetical protein